MDSEDQDPERVEIKFKQEFELLKGVFENHFSEDVISGVLEDCDGDVNLALDTLTNIQSIESENSNAAVTETQTNNMTCLPMNSNTETSQTSVSPAAATNWRVNSYAGVSQTPAATPKPPVNKTPIPRPKNTTNRVDYWTDQIRKIVHNHNKGYRTLIIMRGAPGSGKTYLARAIVESTIGTANSNKSAMHVFSADDFFTRNGRYEYDISLLDSAHIQCKNRVFAALAQGLSPVIVDNTSMMTWEMYSYVNDGVNNGYIIEVVEPNNPWSRNVSQLAKRNSHGVPRDKIQRMLERYQGHFTGESLLKYFKLSYPKNMKPPILRNSPIYEKTSPAIHSIPELMPEIEMNDSPEDSVCPLRDSMVNHVPVVHNIPIIIETPIGSKQIVSNNHAATGHNEQLTNCSQKELDEMAKVEIEWDKGNAWDLPSSSNAKSHKDASSSGPKPQRTKDYNDKVPSEKLLETSMIDDDWTKIALFMPPWNNDTTSRIEEITPIQVKISSSTCIETGDFINKNNHKILFTHPRNINNKNIQNEQKEKIPNQRMLDKSTATHESFVPGVSRCPQEDKHFNAMKKMFKNISRPVLREIFDQCNGDVNWASDVVLDDLDKNAIQLNTMESDSEEEEGDYCECWATYNIIPDKSSQPLSTVPVETPPLTPTFMKKPKKDKTVSDGSVIIKRQIEKNIMISDNHYSEQQLRMRRMRRDLEDKSNEPASSNDNNEVIPMKTEQNAGVPGLNIDAKPFDLALPGTSKNMFRDIPSTSASAIDVTCVPGTSGMNNTETVEYTDEEDSLESDDDRSMSSESNLMSVNIGMEFVKQLDATFGRADFEYPEGVKPVLNIPKSILHQINALWIESISNQLDKNNTQTQEMIDQDAELARQVSLQLEEDHEEETVEIVTEEVHPPRELDFKEIMDSDLALAIYEKEVKEVWKSKEPQDIAAKMTREKLYKLFPEVNKEVLSEFLMAHNNNFMDTVEALMASTGLTQYFEQENPVEVFIKAREREIESRLPQEQEEKVGLDTKEWPSLLSKDGSTPSVITLEEVEKMRERAEQFKVARDKYFVKAKLCYDNKKLQEASFYSKQAAELTAHYDRASSYAAAMLMHVHATNNPESNVIDLHFLRVAEASTSLDLFIDHKVNQLRSQVAQGKDPKTLVLHIITGRGKHSPGRARVKPAVMKRLNERGITFRPQNPGLLEAKLKPTHQLTDELLTS